LDKNKNTALPEKLDKRSRGNKINMMKNLKKTFLVAICAVTINCKGQQLLTNKIINQNIQIEKDEIFSKSGINKIGKTVKKKQLNKKKVNEYNQLLDLLQNSNKSDLLLTNSFSDDQKDLKTFINRYNDKIKSNSLTPEEIEELKAEILIQVRNKINTLEEGEPKIEFNCDTCFEETLDDDCVKIIGSASLNDLNSISSSKGTMSFGGYFRLDKRNSIYMFFNTKPDASSDSSSAGKTFIFPELSSRDFIVGYSYGRIYNKNWSESFFTEISLCKHSNMIDTSKNLVNFNSTQIIIGMRFSKTYYYTINKKPHTIGFSFIPYFQGISVSSKYADSYRKTLDGYKNLNGGSGKEDLPLGIFAAGIRGQIDFEDFSFFCNTKFPLNTSNSGNINNDLKQFVYTIGVAISPKIIGF
jgi:hypothetical protein